jgi:hypothetical protein
MDKETVKKVIDLDEGISELERLQEELKRGFKETNRLKTEGKMPPMSLPISVILSEKAQTYLLQAVNDACREIGKELEDL